MMYTILTSGITTPSDSTNSQFKHLTINGFVFFCVLFFVCAKNMKNSVSRISTMRGMLDPMRGR
jgi:hypothetical protein